MKVDKKRAYRHIYGLLLKRFGPRGWWPARTRFEVIVGAVLTQNTSWSNASAAIANLRGARLLSYRKMRTVSLARLSKLIRPALYYNTKARYLKNVLCFMRANGGGDLEKMFGREPQGLRERLLAVKGIGEETADSILLYAGGIPSFVVDAYTRRIFSRLGLFRPEVSYAAMKGEFESHLPRRVKLYNEYHALITTFGHRLCKTKPLCDECPLRGDAALGKLLKPLRGCIK